MTSESDSGCSPTAPPEGPKPRRPLGVHRHLVGRQITADWMLSRHLLAINFLQICPRVDGSLTAALPSSVTIQDAFVFFYIASFHKLHGRKSENRTPADAARRFVNFLAQSSRLTRRSTATINSPRHSRPQGVCDNAESAANCMSVINLSDRERGRDIKKLLKKKRQSALFFIDARTALRPATGCAGECAAHAAAFRRQGWARVSAGTGHAGFSGTRSRRESTRRQPSS